MAGKIKDMSQVKQMLRLHQNGVSNRQTAAELSVNKGNGQSLHKTSQTQPFNH
jgi:hypothetical protein